MRVGESVAVRNWQIWLTIVGVVAPSRVDAHPLRTPLRVDSAPALYGLAGLLMGEGVRPA
jgi:hypothetical protein